MIKAYCNLCRKELGDIGRTLEIPEQYILKRLMLINGSWQTKKIIICEDCKKRLKDLEE